MIAYIVADMCWVRDIQCSCDRNIIPCADCVFGKIITVQPFKLNWQIIKNICDRHDDEFVIGKNVFLSSRKALLKCQDEKFKTKFVHDINSVRKHHTNTT